MVTLCAPLTAAIPSVTFYQGGQHETLHRQPHHTNRLDIRSRLFCVPGGGPMSGPDRAEKLARLIATDVLGEDEPFPTSDEIDVARGILTALDVVPPEELADLLEKALTWEGRLNAGNQAGAQSDTSTWAARKLEVLEEKKAARTALAKRTDR